MTKYSRILCPTDFSATAQHAVEHAAALARAQGGELVLLYAMPPLSYPLRGLGMAEALPNLHEQIRLRATEQLQAVQKGLGAGVKSRIEVRDGEAYEAILACAKELQADLIVIGTHGHTGIKHMLLGSSAERVVRLANCPVLTVRHRG